MGQRRDESGFAKCRELFQVAFLAFDRRRHGADVSETEFREFFNRRVDHLPSHGLVADDASLADLMPTGFELGLDQTDKPTTCLQVRYHGWDNEFERDEGNVDRRQADIEGQVHRRQVPGVDPFHDEDPLIGAQLPVELTAAHVERDYAPGAAFKQNIGETSGGSTDIETVEPPGGNVELIECRHELEGPA